MKGKMAVALLLAFAATSAFAGNSSRGARSGGGHGGGGHGGGGHGGGGHAVPRYAAGGHSARVGVPGAGLRHPRPGTGSGWRYGYGHPYGYGHGYGRGYGHAYGYGRGYYPYYGHYPYYGYGYGHYPYGWAFGLGLSFYYGNGYAAPYYAYPAPAPYDAGYASEGPYVRVANGPSEEDAYRDEPPEAGPAETAELRLFVQPDDASVYVDDRFRGIARRLARLSLAPGRHRVQVARPGFRSADRDVYVEPDRAVSLQIELERP
jgi:hypothetical protein